MSESDFTRDTLLRGKVILHQPRKGFRSSLDPVLLAGFLAPPYGHFLDIGAGTGAVSFLLLAKDDAASGVAVEVQDRLAALAESGRRENSFADRLRVVHGDVQALDESFTGAFDLVATNPPFRPIGQGNLPPRNERAIAHHEVSLTLRDWASVASRCLRTDGRLGVVFPADRLDDLRRELPSVGLPIVRVRLVVPRIGEVPNRCLVEARRTTDPVESNNEAALVVHEGGGYSPELRAMLGE